MFKRICFVCFVCLFVWLIVDTYALMTVSFGSWYYYSRRRERYILSFSVIERQHIDMKWWNCEALRRFRLILETDEEKKGEGEKTRFRMAWHRVAKTRSAKRARNLRVFCVEFDGDSKYVGPVTKFEREPGENEEKLKMFKPRKAKKICKKNFFFFFL